MKQHFSDQTKKKTLLLFQLTKHKVAKLYSNRNFIDSLQNVSVYLALGNQTLSQELMNWTR